MLIGFLSNNERERAWCAGSMKQMVRDLPKLILNPSVFYAELQMDRGNGKAICFLLLCSLVHGALTGLYALERGWLVGGIAFLNAFLSPFFIAFLLYAVAAVLSRKAFTYHAMMVIMAYAGVTCLVSWIPGMAWIAGLWRVFLVGTGLVQAGGITRGRAFGVLTVTVLVFLVIMRMLGPITGAA